ncbi:MAG: inner membrane-spanning protein YciB [Pseudomonadota bacterium]
MQLLIDFLPILLFFGAYVITGNLFNAIAVIIVAAPFAFLVQWLMTRKINKISAISTLLVVVLGGLSLWLDNKAFFIWKPTALYIGLAVAFLASEFFAEKPFVRRMMEVAGGDEPIQLPEEKWCTLNRVWAAFFVFAGALNIWVAYTFSEPTWVKFKLFGLFGLTAIFIVGQAFWLAKYIETSDDE